MIKIYPIILLSITIFPVSLLLSQDKQEENKNDLVLVKVASLNTIDSNKEFQKNVQLVQQQRALAAQTLTKLNSTTDEKEKASLQKLYKPKPSNKSGICADSATDKK